MKQSRIENLADGIFAIVMTLLVIEIKVPSSLVKTDYDLFLNLINITPLFLSYFLSFATLYTYWRAHHFTVSSYAKNVDDRLAGYNAIFLFLVALIPFSSHLLGQYSNFLIPVLIFSIHVIAIGLSLFLMRHYAQSSTDIENEKISKYEENHAYARILVPVFCATIAMFISFYSITLALVFLTIGILFNLSRRSTKIIFSVIKALGFKVEG